MNKDISILLCGETGTGKEAFARAIHDASQRAERPFVALNCAAIPETLIESELFGYRRGAFTGARREGMRGSILLSDSGTLFLDEIGDMPRHLQSRLLRVLEQKEVIPLGEGKPIPVDLHVISASNRDLKQLVERHEFREDLYYRLNGLVLTLPPIRNRRDKDDLIRCALAAENDTGKSVAVEEGAFARLLEYRWPGNIRELRNVLRTALALSDGGTIRLADLPRHIARPDSADGPGDGAHQLEPREQPGAPEGGRGRLESAEREVLLAELERNRWNVTTTAERLRMSRSTLYRKLKKHGIPFS